MAYLDGEADPQIALHLQQCPYCQERVETLAREQDFLSSRLHRITCPSSEELGEFHLRMLPPDRMLVVSQHLRECPHCTRELDQLQVFLQDLSPDRGGGLLQGTKLLIAHLVGGRRESGGAGTPSFALRGEEKGPITFEAEGIVIILDVQPTNEGKVSILGQVAADDQNEWTGATVVLQQTGASPKTVYLDDLGAFRFEEAPSGSAQITITSPHGIEVQIPKIDLNV